MIQGIFKFWNENLIVLKYQEIKNFATNICNLQTEGSKTYEKILLNRSITIVPEWFLFRTGMVMTNNKTILEGYVNV